MRRPVAKRRTKKTAAKVSVSKVAAAKVAATATERPVKRSYIFAVGRRKEAVARVRWYRLQGQGEITVNRRPLTDYFRLPELQQTILDPFVLTHQEKQGSLTVKVSGGGVQGQAEAVRLGIARVMVKDDPDVRLVLKRAGYLRRDPRVKERKKYGLKRARRAPQWQKR